VAHFYAPVRDQILHDAHHEQGIAIGSSVDHGCQLGWKCVRMKALA
jgi:hypothetical protein